MRTEARVKQFDCVGYMREARDRISVEIAGMNHDDLMRWVHSYRYSDPLLADLATRPSESVEGNRDES